MTTYYVLGPLDVLCASKLHAVTLTPVGAACSRCQRILSVTEWAEPCDPVLTQPLSIPEVAR